jgi:hypothetical protein
MEQDRAILDVLRAWAPPFNPSGVIAECAEILKAYHISRLEGDRYSAEFVVEQFRSHNVTYTAADRDASTLYLELLPLVNAQRARLLDHSELLKELRGLERRRGQSGKDRVTHRPGAHDDLANATAGALVVAAESARATTRIFFPEPPPAGVQPLHPEKQQILAAYPRVLDKPSREFSCGSCRSFDPQNRQCTVRKIGTRSDLFACEAYQPQERER